MLFWFTYDLYHTVCHTKNTHLTELCKIVVYFFIHTLRFRFLQKLTKKFYDTFHFQFSQYLFQKP